MYLGNSLYHVQRGSAVMISPDVHHRSFGAAPYSGICIEFSDKYIDDTFSSRACASIRSCFRKQILTLDENALDAVYANTVCAKSDKREENRCLLNIMNILRGFSASGAADNSLSGGSDMSNIGYYPVSYTHLDVYKRQRHSRFPSMNRRRWRRNIHR